MKKKHCPFFRIESTLVSLGWCKIEDKMDESFKLKWVECKSQINYNSFRDGEYKNPLPTCRTGLRKNCKI